MPKKKAAKKVAKKPQTTLKKAPVKKPLAAEIAYNVRNKVARSLKESRERK